MNRARLLSTLLDLIQIDSPSKREAAVASYCKDELEKLGCKVSIDKTSAATGSDTGNLVATLPGSLPGKLYFSAHMDTVSPGEGIVPVITDGIIRSKGDTILGGDDKVGIAVIIEMIKTLKEEARPHPTIVVLLSVCEEISLLGAMSIDASDFRGEPCFVLDGDGKPGVVVIGSPFHYEFAATFTGRAAHAGIEPEKGISAIRLAAKAVLGMELGRLDDQTTANVGTIAGGNAINIIADTCVLTGEFRVLDETKVETMKAQLASAMYAATEEMGGQVALEWTGEYAGFKIPEQDSLVQLVLREAKKLGLETKTMVSG